MDKTRSISALERHLINAVLFLMVIMLRPVLVGAKCEKNFESFDKYCYYLKKEPERFTDRFAHCPGNLFTLELYTILNLSNPDMLSLWTDYKTLYPGSILTDMSHTSSMGTVLNTSTNAVSLGKNVSLDDELCVLSSYDKRLSMVGCEERHYRYCVMETDVATSDFKRVNFTLMSDGDNIKLFVDYIPEIDSVDLEVAEKDIMCFRDSEKYLYKIPTMERDSYDKQIYTITPTNDGYYWCTHSDSTKYFSSESNKVLYIDKSFDDINLYAVKIKTFTKYEMNDYSIKKMADYIWPKLQEYVFFYNEYSNSKKMEPYDNVTVMNFKNDHPYLNYTTSDTLLRKEVTRLYLDAHTVLLHVEMVSNKKPVKPAEWGDSISIEYMKPVYYCDKDKVPKIGPGMNYTGPDCKLFKCERNDFTAGLDLVTTLQEGCSLPTTTASPETTPTTPRSRNHENHLEDVTTQLKNLVSSNDSFTMKDFYNVIDQPWHRTPLTQVITQLKEFLTRTDPIMVEDIEKVFTKVDDILNTKEIDIPGNFLQLLDGIGARIDLNGTNNSTTVKKNIALLVAEAQPGAPIKGIRVYNIENGTFANDDFKFISKEINTTESDTNEMIVYLPDSVSESKRRISFVVYSNNQAFQESRKYHAVNSRVVSIKVENLTKFADKEGIDIYLKPLKHKLKRNQKRTCGFWRFNNDDTGSWSQKGCYFNQALQTDQLDVCHCNHLTHFAEILVSRTVFSKIHEDILEKLSVIGCCVSILGLFLVILTAVLFRSWRREFSNKVWLQLCISIMILSVCFLIQVFVEFERDDILCPLTGVVLHYSVLSSFCWMVVAAVVSYRKLVAVLSPDPTHKLLRASAFAWGAPCAVVGILLAANQHSYDGQFEENSPSAAFCYPKGLALWMTVYAPITVMLLSNLALFVLIVRSVFGKRRPNYHVQNYNKEAWRCASVSCLLVSLFGLPWIFGLLSSNVVFSYLFTILVTFQGFVLFIFFVCNKKTRDLWLIKLKIKRAKIPLTSSSATQLNKLMGVSGGSLDPRKGRTK